MANSRLNNHLKKQAVQNLFLVLIGFFVIIIAAIIFGAKLLVGFSLMLEKFQGNSTDTNTNQQSENYIAPPSLNPVVTATNSAQIAVSGFAEKNQTINLYLNDQQVDKTSVGSDNKFQFPTVTLNQGQNTLKVKAISDNTKESSYSNTDTVLYLKDPPSLTINKPSDGQGFSKSSSPTISIEGTTDPNAKVTVNGLWAIVTDQGSYNYLYTLQDGDNDLKVVASDDAGNQTTKEIHIHTQ